MKKKEFVGVSSLLGAAFIYGFFGVLTKMIGYELPLFYQSWTRGFLCAGVLFIGVLWSKNWVKVEKRDWYWIAIRGFLGSVIGFFSSFIAFFYLPIGTAYFIFYGGATISGYIAGKILFKEHLTFVKLASLILAIVGLFIIFYETMQFSNPLYIAIALLGGFGSATWNTTSKKISGRYSATQLNFLDFLIGSTYVFIISLFMKEQWVMPTLTTPWIASLLFAALFISTGQLVIVGFKRVEAQVGTIIMLAEILFGIIFGYLIFKETVTLYSLIGGLIIIAAIVLPELNWKKLKRKN